MKLITISILLFSCVMIVNLAEVKKAVKAAEKTAEKTAKAENKAESKDKNFPGYNPVPDSVTYGYASNNNYLLQDMAGFKDAQIMEKIPEHLNSPFTGVVGEANAWITNKSYYDGSNNLSAIHVDCNVYTTNPQGCVHNSKCGWCGDKGSCIPGNSSGPLSPCLRNTFLYMAPSPEWNPLKASTINILAVDQKGNPQNHITWEPKDFGKVDVHNPYK